jgi:Predicted transcriptional regulators
MSKFTKKGLGKGLSALFGDSNVQSVQKHKQQKETKTQKTALIGDLNRNQYQPRTKFDENKLNELSKSIKQNGLIQPIAVRPE